MLQVLALCQGSSKIDTWQRKGSPGKKKFNKTVTLKWENHQWKWKTISLKSIIQCWLWMEAKITEIWIDNILMSFSTLKEGKIHLKLRNKIIKTYNRFKKNKETLRPSLSLLMGLSTSNSNRPAHLSTSGVESSEEKEPKILSLI